MKKIIHKHIAFTLILFSFIGCFLFSSLAYAQSPIVNDTSTTTTRVAAGGYLPVTVKLVNFGSIQRIDVQITYKIINANGDIVLSQHETVAVDTTASFVKQLLVPAALPPGTYRAESDIQYPDQTAPAASSFEFKVERTLFGIFLSDLYLYIGLALILGTLCFFAGRLIIRSRARRVTLHDYGDKPKEERIYYEMISDMIGQMRQRAGDRALEIAIATEGLAIDEKNGRVLKITESPSKVVAGLISGYEKALGKKVSFSLRGNENSKKL